MQNVLQLEVELVSLFTKPLLSFATILLVVSICNCSETNPEESGIFPNTTLIRIETPLNNSEIHLDEFPISFIWENDEVDLETIIVFSGEPFEIENQRIQNIEDLVAGWRLSFKEGDNGSITSDEIGPIEDGKFFTPDPPYIFNSQVYYWAIYSYDTNGNLISSSKEYKFIVL